MGNKHSITLHLIQDKKVAQSLLDIAEKEDYYLEDCYSDRANSLARRNLNYTANSISPIDMNTANSFIQTVRLPLKLSNELGEINIIQLMPSSDGGMPHTRPGIICYPTFSFSSYTLIHELWHVHQRKYKDYWSHIFKQIGWTVWNGYLPDKLEHNRRYNPDTVDSPLWIFKNTWVPVPIFLNIMNPSMDQCEVWFYNISGYYTRLIPDELATYYTGLDNIELEHPREITAYMLSEHQKFSSPGYNDLITAIGRDAL
jgi:hypothetical protein